MKALAILSQDEMDEVLPVIEANSFATLDYSLFSPKVKLLQEHYRLVCKILRRARRVLKIWFDVPER